MKLWRRKREYNNAVKTKTRCNKAPEGWQCSRPSGHPGPCAAVRTFITRGDKEIGSVGDLEWPQVAAMLQTMGEDPMIDLEKLEIRKKANGMWRVIVKAGRKKEDENKNRTNQK